MRPKAVLVLSGLDPTGGAGLAADIETISYFDATPLPIATTLTSQNTQSVKRKVAVDNAFIAEQFTHLLADIEIAAVKIGLLADAAQIEVLATLLADLKVPIVLDPIIKSSADNQFLDQDAISSLTKNLLPLTTFLTPNLAELHTLSDEQNEQKAVEMLPCEWLLVTTATSSKSEVTHHLYHHGKLQKRLTYQKLPHLYHGSGCTLSAAICALLAHGKNPTKAATIALDYTHQSLKTAKKLGKMQHHPHRIKKL